MNLVSRFPRGFLGLLFLACCSPFSASAETPSFITRDPRLPNPDRPYDMTSRTVHFLEAHDFGLYDLTFQATNPRQLDVPTMNKEGNWEFDSKYDIAYEAQVSFGLGPVHRVIGMGSAHVRGIGPGGPYGVYDTELIELDLQGLSSRPGGDFLFRESPTLRSSGKTMVGDGCPVCDSIIPIYRVSSFIDIFAEASPDGGMTWAPADREIHVVQQAEPVILGDYNQNGTVDTADYVVWRKLEGPGGLPNEGGVSNNLVDEADYRFWRSRFGDTAEDFFYRPTVPAVPEPSACVFLVFSALSATVARFRKRST
jgi:hypothetical protein